MFADVAQVFRKGQTTGRTLALPREGIKSLSASPDSGNTNNIFQHPRLELASGQSGCGPNKTLSVDSLKIPQLSGREEAGLSVSYTAGDSENGISSCISCLPSHSKCAHCLRSSPVFREIPGTPDESQPQREGSLKEEADGLGVRRRPLLGYCD